MSRKAGELAETMWDYVLTMNGYGHHEPIPMPCADEWTQMARLIDEAVAGLVGGHRSICGDTDHETGHPYEMIARRALAGWERESGTVDT